jgi:hypothetical protein
MRENIFGMERETYQGSRIDHEPDTDATKGYRDHWFNVYAAARDRHPLFRVRMRIHCQYAIKVIPQGVDPVRGSSQLAEHLGLRWVHGLVDTDRYERDRIHDEERTDEWQADFGSQDLDDGNLRLELLRALRRMNRAQNNTAEILALDVDGVADVLGVPGDRVRGVLGEMVLEGLVEESAATYGHGPEDGACRITGDGLRELRRAQGREESARLVHVDDIESFARVREVPPGEVASMLASGLLPVPEADVKRYLCEIIGENYDHKDWGGERSDVFTTQVRHGGRRVATAFLLKGPGVGHAVMRPSDLGARADQDLRLFTEPAELFIVQFNGRVQRVRITADDRARRQGPTLVCFIDGTDTARILKAYGKDSEARSAASS